MWQVSTEWHALGFHSALLTKVNWKYATHIVRVCVTTIAPQTSKLDLNDNCKLQVHSGSKAMASVFELLCHPSLTTKDPLLKEMLSYLPAGFRSHIFHFFCI